MNKYRQIVLGLLIGLMGLVLGTWWTEIGSWRFVVDFFVSAAGGTLVGHALYRIVYGRN